MNKTAIQWTWRRDPATGELVPMSGSTWNPLAGCRRVSPGCENCYAERLLATRLRSHKAYVGLAVMGEHGPRFTGEHRLIPERLDEPLRASKARSIFVCDLSDLFFEGNTNEEIAAVYGIMALASWHTFQVLTKRVKRALDWYQWVRDRPLLAPAAVLGGTQPFEVCTREARRYIKQSRPLRTSKLPPLSWPLSNVHVGCSVEDQKRAEERIPLLLEIPAAVRFLSVEPQLGPVDLSRWFFHVQHPSWDAHEERRRHAPPRVGWVIVGGESGPGARVFNVDWARSLVRQCRAARVACFVKQLGAQPISENGYLPKLNDSHGGDPDEWDPDLRVRQLPGDTYTIRALTDGSAR